MRGSYVGNELPGTPTDITRRLRGSGVGSTLPIKSPFSMEFAAYSHFPPSYRTPSERWILDPTGPARLFLRSSDFILNLERLS